MPQGNRTEKTFLSDDHFHRFGHVCICSHGGSFLITATTKFLFPYKTLNIVSNLAVEKWSALWFDRQQPNSNFRTFHTLYGTVVFVSRNPGELNTPLCLVSQFQVSWRVRFLCEHNEEPRTTEKWKLSSCYWLQPVLATVLPENLTTNWRILFSKNQSATAIAVQVNLLWCTL